MVLRARPFMFNYQQIVLLSFLVFFLLVALSLTPFARGRPLLQVIGLLLGGAAARPQPNRFSIEMSKLQKISLWRPPKGPPLIWTKNVTNEAFLVKVNINIF